MSAKPFLKPIVVSKIRQPIRDMSQLRTLKQFKDIKLSTVPLVPRYKTAIKIQQAVNTAGSLNPLTQYEKRINDVRSTIHSVNPVSIVREKVRDWRSNNIRQIVEKVPLIHTMVCVSRAVKKSVLIAKKLGGTSTPKTRNLLSNIKCSGLKPLREGKLNVKYRRFK